MPDDEDRFFCMRGFYSGCKRSNPDKEKAEKLWGHSPADMMDTKVGDVQKDNAADVAGSGYEAMMKGEGEVVTGWPINCGSPSLTSLLPTVLLRYIGA